MAPKLTSPKGNLSSRKPIPFQVTGLEKKSPARCQAVRATGLGGGNFSGVIGGTSAPSSRMAAWRSNAAKAQLPAKTRARMGRPTQTMVRPKPTVRPTARKMK